jgi:hypothetical protein
MVTTMGNGHDIHYPSDGNRVENPLPAILKKIEKSMKNSIPSGKLT